jgi:hypothetical protein
MSHGDHSGPIALIDRSKGPFDTEAITNITPDTRPQYQMSRSHHDTFRDPYPISRDHFLVAHNPDNQHNWGLYVIDRYGNREWLYADPGDQQQASDSAASAAAAARVAQFARCHAGRAGLGQFTVQDVYQGLGATVARGRAKYLQVSPKRFPRLWSASLRAVPRGPSAVHRLLRHARSPGARPDAELRHADAQCAAGQPADRPQLAQPGDGGRAGTVPGPRRRGLAHFVAKRSLGTVPIAEDGSANFLAPAGKVLYFQLLDAEYNELQRMRSVIQLQPGERRSCIGCHEDRHPRRRPRPDWPCCSRRSTWSRRRGAPRRSITNGWSNRC